MVLDIDPYYLVVFLRSQYGFDQLMRERELTIQYQLTLERVGRILIYKPKNCHLEEMISIIFRKYQMMITESHNLYLKAEELLLSELGLSDFKEKKQLFYVKKFSETVKHDRSDAEYFQPKYDEIYKKLVEKGCKNLEDHFQIINSSNFSYVSTGDIGVIKTKQVGKYFLNFNVEDKTTTHIINDYNLPIIEDRDVIFASMGVGSLGRASIFYKFENHKSQYTIDSTLRIIKQKNEMNISPEVLCIFLNSKIGQSIIYRYIVGTSGIINIYDKYLLKIPIPLLNPRIDVSISNLVKKAHYLRKNAKILFEIAKKGVEVAIEKNEEYAVDWMKHNFIKHGIEMDFN